MKVRSNIYIVILSVLFAFTAVNCHAQNAPAPIPSSDAKLIKQVGEVGAFYFTKADIVKANAFFYALGSVNDIDQEKDVITMTFTGQVQGNTLKKPETFTLSLTAKSKVSKYSKNHRLRLFADKTMILDADMTLARTRREGVSYGTEIFTLGAIKYDVFERLAKAKSVEVQIGETIVPFGTEQQKRIRNLLDIFEN